MLGQLSSIITKRWFQLVLFNSLTPAGFNIALDVLRLPWTFNNALVYTFIFALNAINFGYFYSRLGLKALSIIVICLNLLALVLIGDTSFFTAVPKLTWVASTLINHR